MLATIKTRIAKSIFQPSLKYYDAVRFRYGYTKRTMLFKLNGISIGKGHSEWGAPDNEVFILKLGNRIKV